LCEMAATTLSNPSHRLSTFAVPVLFKIAVAFCCLSGAITIHPLPAFGQAMDIAILDTRGYRTSKLIGQPVFNEEGQKIGKVDEIVLTLVGDTIFVVQIGPYIGVHNRLVLFPFSQIKIDNKTSRIVATSASKDDLKKMAAFIFPDN
jgi:sporulation protein YlmC with PRC-barrel domain